MKDGEQVSEAKDSQPLSMPRFFRREGMLRLSLASPSSHPLGEGPGSDASDGDDDDFVTSAARETDPSYPVRTRCAVGNAGIVGISYQYFGHVCDVCGDKCSDWTSKERDKWLP